MLPMFPTLAAAVCLSGALPEQLTQVGRIADLTIMYEYWEVYDLYGVRAPTRCFNKGTFVATVFHTLLDPVQYTFDWMNPTTVTVQAIDSCEADERGAPLPPCLPPTLEVHPND